MSSDAAFPYRYQEIPGDPVHHYHGLTKREYLAGLAMQALIAKIPLHDRLGEMGVHTPTVDDIRGVRLEVAKSACGYADALLAALNEPREP